MDDRSYFSDWGGCTCDPDVDALDPECPLYDDHAEEMEEEDE
jgi:hypothetical protein